jgi:hypothetical protein
MWMHNILLLPKKIEEEFHWKDNLLKKGLMHLDFKY